jgi:hypothetical protein
MKTFLNNNTQLVAGIIAAVIFTTAFVAMIAEHGFRNF